MKYTLPRVACAIKVCLQIRVLLTKCGPYKIYAAGLKTPD